MEMKNAGYKAMIRKAGVRQLVMHGRDPYMGGRKWASEECKGMK